MTATCSTDAVALVESLGADVVIDYTAPEADEHLSLMRGSVRVSGRPNSVLRVLVYFFFDQNDHGGIDMVRVWG